MNAARRPWHLWLAGIIGLLWSLMGLVSFMLTQLRVEAVMSRYPPQQRAYFESFPFWSVACWGIGVIAGLIGCVLLLNRNRRAPLVLLVSLVGWTVSSLGGLFLLGGMQVMRETDGVGLAMVPVIVAALLVLYARAMRRKSVL